MLPNSIYLSLFTIPLSLEAPTSSLYPVTKLTASNSTMSLFANIVGFSLFGLAARIGQLGIQKRNLFESTPPVPRFPPT